MRFTFRIIAAGLFLFIITKNSFTSLDSDSVGWLRPGVGFPNNNEGCFESLLPSLGQAWKLSFETSLKRGKDYSPQYDIAPFILVRDDRIADVAISYKMRNQDSFFASSASYEIVYNDENPLCRNYNVYSKKRALGND